MNREQKEAKKELNDILLGNEKKAKEWIEIGIKQLNVKDIENAINEGVEPSIILFNHFSSYTLHPILKHIIRLVFRKFWDIVESSYTDVQNVYDMLIKNRPDMEKILDTKKGRRWLNYAVSASFANLYRYVWLNEDLNLKGE